MAGTRGKGASGKKPAAKKKSAAPKKKAAKSPPRAAPAPSRTSRSPIYLLVIMALLAAVIFLANALFFGDREGKRSGEGGRPAVEKEVRGLQEVRKEERRDAVPGVKKDDVEKKETAAPARQVKVYFIHIDERTERIIMAPVLRTFRGEVTVRQAMEELIKGPTASEKRRGLVSAVPETLRVRGVSVNNRVAEIDFNGAIEQNAAGSILIGRLDQIVFTATELSGVDSVLIKVNGRRRQSLGADGLSIGGPLHRRQ